MGGPDITVVEMWLWGGWVRLVHCSLRAERYEKI